MKVWQVWFTALWLASMIFFWCLMISMSRDAQRIAPPLLCKTKF